VPTVIACGLLELYLNFKSPSSSAILIICSRPIVYAALHLCCSYKFESICVHNITPKIIGCMHIPIIPYSRKVWLEESLVNLANHKQFAKLKPSKFLLTIITFWLNLSICQTFFAKCSKRVNLPNFIYFHQTFLLYGSLQYC